MLLKIEAYSYRPSLLRDLAVSLKYKWQRMKTMTLLLLTTTFYFDWLECSHHCKSLEVKVANGNKIGLWVTSDHYCVGYVRSTQRPRVAVPGKPSFSTNVFMAFLQFHATHFVSLFVTPDTLIRTHSLYFLLVLIVINTRSSLEVRTISEWNKLSQDVWSKPSVVSFRSTLLKTAGPVENGTPAVT